MAIAKTTQAAIDAAQPRKKIQLASTAAAPKLVSLLLDDDDTFNTFGGDLEFFVLDRYPVAQFMDFMLTAEKAKEDVAARNKVIEMVLPMMLDSEGKTILNVDPITALAAVHKIMEHLGNLSARNLIGNHLK